MEVIVCDFCKKPIVGADNKYRIHRKLFQKECVCRSDNVAFLRWTNVDVCRDCLIDFMSVVRAKRSGGDEE